MSKGTVSIEALKHISRISSGGMRDAITLLDKCLSLSHDLTLENVLSVVGGENYDTFFLFLDKLCTKNSYCISIIEDIYNEGKDVKQFMKDFSKFILEVEKYLIYRSTEYINIPATQENIDKLEIFMDFRNEIFNIMELVVDINNQLKWDSDPKTLIELSILIYCGKE